MLNPRASENPVPVIVLLERQHHPRHWHVSKKKDKDCCRKHHQQQYPAFICLFEESVFPLIFVLIRSFLFHNSTHIIFAIVVALAKSVSLRIFMIE